MNFKLWLEDTGDVAKAKITAPIGENRWHMNEKVIKTEPFNIDWGMFQEEWYLIFTESINIVGGKNGRVLIAIDHEQTNDFAGGFFWITEYNKKKMQSIWVDPEMRKGKVGPILANIARSMGIQTAIGPFSDAGQAYAKRYKFKTEN